MYQRPPLFAKVQVMLKEKQASRRAGRAIAAYYQTSAARRAAQDRIDAWGTLLALAAFALLVAFKIGGAA